MRLRATPLAGFATLAALALAGLCPLGCSSPDNLVVGGILGSGTAPNATIVSVGSAISGAGNITDVNGNPSPRELLVLSDIPDLCAVLTANPDFLQTPTSAFVMLVLSLPPGMVGTFYPGAAGTEAGLFASAAADSAVYGYPGVGGTVTVNQFDSAQANGTFDIEVDDTLGDENEVYGNFKTTQCDGLAGALIPNIVLGQ